MSEVSLSSEDFCALWNDLLRSLYISPPKMKLSGLKKFTQSSKRENNIFKGRDLVDWLETYLRKTQKFKQSGTPEHAHRLGSNLLKYGVIANSEKNGNFSDSISASSDISVSAISHTNEQLEPFSLRSRYYLKPEDEALSSFEKESTDFDDTDVDTEMSDFIVTENKIKKTMSITSSESLPIDFNDKRRPSLQRSITSSLSFLKERKSSLSGAPSSNSLSEKLGSVYPDLPAKLASGECCEYPFPDGRMIDMSLISKVAQVVDSLPMDDMVKVGDIVSDFQLPNQKGNLKKLSSYLKKGPVILNFFLGGVCPMCVAEIEYYNEILDYIELTGSRVVTITPETKAELTKTAKRLKIKSAYLSDMGFNVTQDFGACYNTDVFSPELRDFSETTLRNIGLTYGYTTPFPPKFPFRSVFIIDSKFTIRLAFTSFFERVEPATLISILKDIKREESGTGEIRRANSVGGAGAIPPFIRNRAKNKSSSSKSTDHASNSGIELAKQSGWADNGMHVGALVTLNFCLLMFYLFYM